MNINLEVNVQWKIYNYGDLELIELIDVSFAGMQPAGWVFNILMGCALNLVVFS